MTPRAWNTAVGTGLLRLGIGSSLFRWRKPFARIIGGAAAEDRFMPAFFAYFGLRDIAVGVYTLASTRPGGDVVAAERLQGWADTTDAFIIAGAMATGRLGRGRGIVGIATAVVAAVVEFVVAEQLRREAG